MEMNLELLPNEIFIECFQYLNALDIFYSFDRLNYRFNTLIQNIPLQVNFEEIKKSKFNQFCQIILSNPEIKHNIISLKLFNEYTCGQIEEFLSLFPLNEFINLRSLSLIYLTNNNIKQLSSMLPFLSNLSDFSFTSENNRDSQILSKLSNSKLRILSMSTFDSGCTSFFKQMSITSLTIYHCDLFNLCELFKHALMLKYLKIKHLQHSFHTSDLSKLPPEKALYLRQWIVENSSAGFEIITPLLKRIPNLTIFTINAPNQMFMINADYWQRLIESSLPHLRVFNFYFSDELLIYSYNDKLKEFQQFQSNFWCKQHHWYTNYKIDTDSASIYTIPYVWSRYSLLPTIKRYNHSNQYDNVVCLTLSQRAIEDNSPCYFKNVKSLTLIHDIVDGHSIEVQPKLMKYLNKILNLSNIKHLGLTATYKMDLSSLLELLNELLHVSSLGINRNALKRFYKNGELCEYLNRKISTLYVVNDPYNNYIMPNKIDLILKIFSNLEELYCSIKKLDDLLSILRQCSKLVMINLSSINKDIYSWIQINASKLNVHIDFVAIQGIDEDFSITANID